MINLKLFYFVLIFVILYFNNVKSIDLAPTEVQCMSNLSSKSGDIGLLTNPCSIAFTTCLTNGSMQEIVVRATTVNLLTWSDFSCFPALTGITGYGFSIDHNFVYSPNPLIKSIEIISLVNSIPINAPLPKLDYFCWPGFNGESLKLSYIANIKIFSMFGGLISNIENDVINNVTTVISIRSNNVPDLTSFTNLKTFSFANGPNFNSSSNVHIASSSFNNLTDITITGDSMGNLRDFPYEVSSIPNPSYRYISFWGDMNASNRLIDLSNNKLGKDVIVQFISTGINFNYNGLIPVSALPNNTLMFSFYSGNLALLPNLDLFKDIKSTQIAYSNVGGPLPVNTITNLKIQRYVDLSSNKLTGTVDESWCKSILEVRNNLLTGNLPECIYCYLNSSTVAARFGNNQFSNYNTKNRDCGYSQIIPNIEILTDAFGGKKINLYGKNLGFDTSNIQSTPIIYFSDFINGNFTGSYPYPGAKSFEIRFVVPGINFTLSTGETAPVLDVITQSNNTFEIDGSFFNYDKSLVTVKIGTNDCRVSYSTFYKINCEINYPVLDFGNTLVTVKVLSLSSSKYIDLQYTEFPCPLNCSGNNGVCNNHIGKCNCIGNSFGSGCQFNLTSIEKDNTSLLDSYIMYGNYGPSPNILTTTVTIGSTSCQIVNMISLSLVCQVNLTEFGNLLVNVSLNGEVGHLYYYNEPYIPCLNNCSGNGICNTTIGECICNSNYTGIDCSVPISIPCPNNCSGNGVCNTTIGECNCNSNYTGVDCSIPISIPCPNNCSGNGVCDSNGKCNCNSNYSGSDCSTPVVPEEITCEYNNDNGDDIHSLTIYSFVGINCTGTGPTYCVDNIYDATCKSNQTNNLIECTVGKYNKIQLTSITCTGNHIVCRTSSTKCVVNINSPSPQIFSVNDISQTSSAVSIKEIDNDLPRITSLPSSSP